MFQFRVVPCYQVDIQYCPWPMFFIWVVSSCIPSIKGNHPLSIGSVGWSKCLEHGSDGSLMWGKEEHTVSSYATLCPLFDGWFSILLEGKKCLFFWMQPELLFFDALYSCLHIVFQMFLFFFSFFFFFRVYGCIFEIKLCMFNFFRILSMRISTEVLYEWVQFCYENHVGHDMTTIIEIGINDLPFCSSLSFWALGYISFIFAYFHYHCIGFIVWGSIT